MGVWGGGGGQCTLVRSMRLIVSHMSRCLGCSTLGLSFDFMRLNINLRKFVILKLFAESVGDFPAV